MLAKTTKSLPILKLASARWKTVSAAASNPVQPSRRAPFLPLRDGPMPPSPQRTTANRGHGLALPVQASPPRAPAACPQPQALVKVNIKWSPGLIWTPALADLDFLWTLDGNGE